MKQQRSKIDVQRLHKAVQGPGVDPRVWCQYAVIQELGYDPDHGILADVKFLPNGEEETCYVGMDYWGNGFGEYNPLAVGDVVKVEYPSGDPAATPVISDRIPQPPFLPSKFMQDENDTSEPTQDKVIVVKPGQKLRIYVTGDGEMDIFAGDDQSTFVKVKDGEILVGDDQAGPVIPSNWATHPTLGLKKVLSTLATALTTAGVTNTLSADLGTLPTAETTKGKIT